MCGESVGVVSDRVLLVVLMTPLDFEASRSRARLFCCIRSACRRNRLSVFGNLSVLWKSRWDRYGFEAEGDMASLLFWAICLVERSGILGRSQPPVRQFGEQLLTPRVQ